MSVFDDGKAYVDKAKRGTFGTIGAVGGSIIGLPTRTQTTALGTGPRTNPNTLMSPTGAPSRRQRETRAPPSRRALYVRGSPHRA
jgi:hypothetical protein